MPTTTAPSPGDDPDGYERIITTGDPVSSVLLTGPDVSTVLAITPHVQALSRILDCLPAVEADHRVQVVYTVPETGYHWAAMPHRLREIDALVMPWRQAVETRFDMVLAACSWGIAEVRRPLVLMSHGSTSIRSRIAHETAEHGLTPAKLMRNGEVLPARLVLATDDEVRTLAGACPEALPAATVAGDPCFDRISASAPFRDRYREALGADPGQRVVFASSTWSRHGLFGSDPTFFSRLADDLADGHHVVVAALHPFVWDAYGRRQVLSWLGPARERGLVVLPPEEGWRAAIVAADVMLTDHGSVGQYAAASGVRTMMSVRALPDVRPGTAADLLSRVAAPLYPDFPLRSQLERVLAAPVDPRSVELAARITGRPGQALSILRQEFYGVLGLLEPGHAVPVSPVPLPKPLR